MSPTLKKRAGGNVVHSETVRGQDRKALPIQFAEMREYLEGVSYRTILVIGFLLLISRHIIFHASRGNEDDLWSEIQALEAEADGLGSRLKQLQPGKKSPTATGCPSSLYPPPLLCPKSVPGRTLPFHTVAACTIQMTSKTCAATSSLTQLTCDTETYNVHGPGGGIDHFKVSGPADERGALDVSVWVMSREDANAVRELEGFDATPIALLRGDVEKGGELSAPGQVRARISYAVVKGGEIDKSAGAIREFLRKKERVAGAHARLKYLSRYPILSAYNAIKASAHETAAKEKEALLKRLQATKLSKTLKGKIVSNVAQVCFWNRFLRGKAIAMLEAACRERQIDAEGRTRRFAYTYFIDGDTFVDARNLAAYMGELESGGKDPFNDPVFTGYLTIRSVLINGGSGMLFNAAAMDKMCAPEAIGGCLRVGLDEHAVSVERGHFDNPMDGGDMRTAVCAAKFAGLKPSKKLSLRSNLLFRPDPPWVKSEVWRRLYYLVNKDMQDTKYDPFSSYIAAGGEMKDIDDAKKFPVVSYHHTRHSVRSGYLGNVKPDKRCRARTTLVGWGEGLKGSLLPVVRCDPRFVIIGAPKAGTTSLFAYLLQHPDMVSPPRKELHLFLPILSPPRTHGLSIDPQVRRDSDEYALRQKVLHVQYLSMFPRISPRQFKITGEASPIYLYSPEAAAFFFSHLPETRLIVMLRDPRTRAYSEYRNKVHDVAAGKIARHYYQIPGNDNPSFEQVVDHGIAAFKACGTKRLKVIYCRRQGILGFNSKEAICCPSKCAQCGGPKCYGANGRKANLCCPQVGTAPLCGGLNPLRNGKVSCRLSCYVAPVLSLGLYAKALRPWLASRRDSRTFRRRFKIMWTDDMRSDPASFVNEVADYVGLQRRDPEDGTLARSVDVSSGRSPYSGRGSRFAFDTSIVYNTASHRGATLPGALNAESTPKEDERKTSALSPSVAAKLSIFYNSSVRELDTLLNDWYSLGTSHAPAHGVPAAWYDSL